MNWNFDSQVIVQGIVRPQVLANALKMRAYGTKIVAGIGTSENMESNQEIPIFDLIEDALSKVTEVETSLIDVEPYEVLDAAQEAIAAGIKNLIILTKNVPPLDTIKLIIHAQNHQVSILGPGSPGLIIPEQISWGNLQPQYFRPGNIGIISYSQYLIYEVARELNLANLGQSIAIGLGQEKISATELAQWLQILDRDPNTQTIVWIEKLSNFESSVVKSFRENTSKPVIAYLLGAKTNESRNFKDVQTILTNHLSHSIPTTHTYTKAVSILKKAGLKIAKKPAQIPQLIS
ncbi:MAG: CoA-binding protein [Xenococcus sp. (in: cyanobacteria)]